MRTWRSHDLWLHISHIHKGTATKSVWAPKEFQTLDAQTQRWDCKEALKMGMKVTRGLMGGWGGKAFPFRELPIQQSVQGADKCEEAVSQSVRQSMSQQSRSVAITWMKFLCWQVTHSLPESCIHSEAANVWGMKNLIPLSLSLISYYRVADASGLRSSIGPAEVPAWRWGAGRCQTGSHGLRKQSGGVLTVCGCQGRDLTFPLRY